MSCGCQAQEQANNQFLDAIFGFAPGSDWVLLFALFVYGVVGSFTHCVGMCGAIAVSQANMRLMHLKSSELNAKNRIICSMAWTYYLGKAITYALLAFAVKSFSIFLSKFVIARYISFALLMFIALISVKIAFSNLLSINIPFLKMPQFFLVIQKRFYKVIEWLSVKPFGVQGVLMGMMLGMLPCGLVMSSITLAIGYTDNPLFSSLAMFFFGIGTFPALFLLSVIGQFFFSKNQKYLRIIYSILMIVNSAILIRFSLKILPIS